MRIPMPGRLLPAAAVALIALSGCDATAPDEEPEVTFQATWGGDEWLGGSQAQLIDGGEIIIHGWTPADSRSMPDRTVSFRTQFDGPGSYPIGASAARIDYLVGGDGLVASYGTTDVHTGTLVIEEVSTTHVRGTIAFDAATTGFYQPAGQQARFEGTFNAPLRQESP